MCRFLGIFASERTEFGLGLTDAPRSLATLSNEHPDGWGIAVHDANARTWQLRKGTERAGVDAHFHRTAARSRGHALIAHIRQKTVGSTRLENTHPFERDGWMFAHNGTVTELALLRARTSPARLRELEGDTDSELLFAHMLTRLDEHGLLRVRTTRARAAATEVLQAIVAELRSHRVGAFNFLLSDGDTCFAHRTGRSMFLLERGPADPVRHHRPVAPGASVTTRWPARRRAVFVASERITDEPWREVPDGTLLRIDRLPTPSVVPVACEDNASSAVRQAS